MNISFNSFSSNTQNIIINQEYRCTVCLFIPFINIFTKENKLLMSTKCTNNHNFSKSFDEMQILCKKSLISNYSCVLCAKENNKKKILMFFIIVLVLKNNYIY